MKRQIAWRRLHFACGWMTLALSMIAPGHLFGQKRSVTPGHVYTNDDVSTSSVPAESASLKTNEANNQTQGNPHGPVGRVAPFVATPPDVVDKILDLAEVSSSDVVYDLGSGDGRIVLRAASKYGARAVGIELDKDLAADSATSARREKLSDLVKIVQGDLFEADVSPATVVVVYLLQAANRRLSPILERDLKPGTRVVAHDIRIPDWRPAEELSIDSGGVQHFIYLYRVPESFRKQ